MPATMAPAEMLTVPDAALELGVKCDRLRRLLPRLPELEKLFARRVGGRRVIRGEDLDAARRILSES